MNKNIQSCTRPVSNRLDVFYKHSGQGKYCKSVKFRQRLIAYNVTCSFLLLSVRLKAQFLTQL